MALRKKLYEMRLESLVEKVRSDPDADFTPQIEELAAELIEWADHRADRVIRDLIFRLYDGDTQELERGITKLMTVGTAKAPPAKRGIVLQNICEELSLHTKEDFIKIGVLKP